MFPYDSFSATKAQKQDCSEAKIWESLPKGSRSTVASISQKQKNCGTTRTPGAGKPETLEKILPIRDRINNQMPNGKCHPGWAPEILSADERKIRKIQRPCSNPPIRADENKLVWLRLGKTQAFGLMKPSLNFSPSAWESHLEECNPPRAQQRRYGGAWWRRRRHQAGDQKDENKLSGPGSSLGCCHLHFWLWSLLVMDQTKAENAP